MASHIKTIPAYKSWLTTAVLVGILYSVIGILFALPSNHVRIWRLAAWAASAVVYAVHIGYEYFRLGNPPRETALHASLAVAVGAFGLAVAANFHELLVMPHYRSSLALALVAWPILIFLPALVVALVTAYGLTLMRRLS